MQSFFTETVSSETPRAPARPRVLVAEDHEDTRHMLRVVLERGGCDVLEASDGEEAVRLAESARPDLVLLDRSLPRLDGLAVARLVRERAGRIPIIFLSDYAEAPARAAAFEAGCDDYLVKPVDLDHLTSVVTRHLAP